jgi:hypothetical protein
MALGVFELTQASDRARAAGSAGELATQPLRTSAPKWTLLSQYIPS